MPPSTADHQSTIQEVQAQENKRKRLSSEETRAAAATISAEYVDPKSRKIVHR
jgi:predicted Zn-dependent protease